MPKHREYFIRNRFTKPNEVNESEKTISSAIIQLEGILII